MVLCSVQIKAVYYNNTPIANTPVYLFEGYIRSSKRLKNLTTDSNGMATFSFCTAKLKGDLWLQVQAQPPGFKMLSVLYFLLNLGFLSFTPGLHYTRAAVYPIQSYILSE